jgi:hypothetical protein
MIARRPKSGFTPSDVQEVRRRFDDIVRKAAHKAEVPSGALVIEKPFENARQLAAVVAQAAARR